MWLEANDKRWVIDYRRRELWKPFENHEVLVICECYRPFGQAISATHFRVDRMRFVTPERGRGPILELGAERLLRGTFVMHAFPAGSKRADSPVLAFRADDGTEYFLAGASAALPATGTAARIKSREVTLDMSFMAQPGGRTCGSLTYVRPISSRMKRTPRRSSRVLTKERAFDHCTRDIVERGGTCTQLSYCDLLTPMKRSIVVNGLLLALVALPLVGCKKKETGTTGGAEAGSAGSGSAGSATGTGSAVADTGSGSGAGAAGSAGSAGSAAGSAAAELAAPWAADTASAPATSKVTAKRNGNDEGSFDRAIYFKYVDDWGSSNYELRLSNCEKFSCAHYIAINGTIARDDKFYADCPGAKTMDIKFYGDEDPKVGPVNVSVVITGPSSGGGLSGEPMKGSSLTAVTDKEVSGKLAVKDGNNEAKGEFVAKNCGTMVFPVKKR